jgi:hypothetical protein
MVSQRVDDLLARYVNPLTGGPDGNGWPFDAELSATAVAGLLEAVDGVERVEEVVLFEYDLRNSTRLATGRESIRPEPHTLFLAARNRVVVR